MKAKRVGREDQLKLIMECRASGLSDYQWCEKRGIHPGTFYNWVSKLKKAGVTIPDSESKRFGASIHQEVVKVDLVPEPSTSTSIMEQNTRILAMEEPSSQAAVEILMGNATIRFFNNSDPELIRITLQCVGGASRAW